MQESDLHGGALLGHSLAVEVPGVVHHQSEVLVVVDAHGHVVIVLKPLVHGDFAVSGVLVALHVAEVVLESVQELVQDFILRLLSGLDVWMLLGVVGLSDVIDVELAGLVSVHDGESLLGNGLSLGVHLSSDGSEELVIRDLSAAVSVEDFESSEDLLVVETDSEITHGLLEFLGIKTLAAVVISNLELLADTCDSSSSSSSDLSLDVLEDLGLVGIGSKSSLRLFDSWVWPVENVVVLRSSWLGGVVS